MMLGLLSSIKGFFSQIFDLMSWLLLGAGIGFTAALFKPWLGYAGAAAIGAIAMFVAITGNWLGDDSKELARLKLENHRQLVKIEEIRATNSALQKNLAEGREAMAKNIVTLSKLNEAIDTISDNPQCDVPKDIRDAINDIR